MKNELELFKTKEFNSFHDKKKKENQNKYLEL